MRQKTFTINFHTRFNPREGKDGKIKVTVGRDLHPDWE